MRKSGGFLTLAILLMSCVSLWAYDPHDRGDNKAVAYRAGYDDGYRSGVRQGEYDFRGHYRFGFRGRDCYRGDAYHIREFRHKGDFKKGYRDGFRQGYQDGYYGRGLHRRDRFGGDYYRHPY